MYRLHGFRLGIVENMATTAVTLVPADAATEDEGREDFETLLRVRVATRHVARGLASRCW